MGENAGDDESIMKCSQGRTARLSPPAMSPNSSSDHKMLVNELIQCRDTQCIKEALIKIQINTIALG